MSSQRWDVEARTMLEAPSDGKSNKFLEPCPSSTLPFHQPCASSLLKVAFVVLRIFFVSSMRKMFEMSPR